MQAPIKVEAEVRWIRKIRERVDEDHRDSMRREFRAGIQFIQPIAEITLALKNYIRRLEVSHAN